MSQTIPTRVQAGTLLAEAERMNPGTWAAHNRLAAQCAEAIAKGCPALDPDTAYVLGILHDIGRRFGACDLRHTVRGYRFMLEQGYETSACICLSHSFACQDIRVYNGSNDCDEEETALIRSFLETAVYDDYDRLIQLCDPLSQLPPNPVPLEKRLVDVVLGKGFDEVTLLKWRALLAAKERFDLLTGANVYELAGVSLW